MAVILLSGVHGVGKSYYLNKISKDLLDYRIINASEVINTNRGIAYTGYKQIVNLEENQITLACEIKRIAKECKNIIIDGHICLITNKADIKTIPVSFITDAGIEGIILLQNEPKLICERLKRRDSNCLDIKVIDSMQKKEVAFSNMIKEELNINNIIVNSISSGNYLKEVISRLMED